MKDQKGITLIALVITIIVMLILVAVTIVFAINGGLFSKANSASEGTRLAQINEAVALTKADLYSDYYDPTNTAGTINGKTVNGVLTRYLAAKTTVDVQNSIEDTLQAVQDRINYYLDTANKDGVTEGQEFSATDLNVTVSYSNGVFTVEKTTGVTANFDANKINTIECDFWKN